MDKQKTQMMEAGIYLFAKALVFPLVRQWWTGPIEGLEHLPERGPYIIAANHSSYMDHFLLAAMMRARRKRKIYFLTRKEAFDSYWSAKWHLATGCIPVDRGNPELAAYRAMAGCLKAGEIVVIYPEGTRSVDGVLLPPKPGAVKLALHANVPIVPIGIVGAARILPKGKLVPTMARAALRVGAPFYPSDHMRDAKSKEELQRAATALMAVIGSLCADRATTPAMHGNEARGLVTPGACLASLPGQDGHDDHAV